jgi:type II secretion system protein N
MAALPPIARRLLLPAAYVVLVTVLFLVLGFPSEALRAYAVRRLSAALPGLEVTVGDVRLALPTGIRLTGVRLAHGDRPIAVVDDLTVRPELLTLLRSTTVYHFEGSLGGGGVSGRMEVDSAGPTPRTRMTSQLGGVQLQQIPAMRDLYGGRMSGRMDGSLALTDAGALSGKLSASEVQVELPAPVLGQDRFSFKTADAEITLQNRSLLVRNGRLRGTELDAEVTGTISLDPLQAARGVNLVGRVTPHPAFLAKTEGSLTAGLLRRRAAIPFRVSGPLDAPGFSLN